MPSVSKKQERFMQAVAHSPSFAKKAGIPQSVGREFTKAEGGTVKDSKEMMAKEVAFMKKKSAPKSMLRHEQAEMKGMSSGMQKKMNMGGMARYARGGGIESHGKTKGTMIRMASGGYVRSADGIASKGKTKGKVV